MANLNLEYTWLPNFVYNFDSVSNLICGDFKTLYYERERERERESTIKCCDQNNKVNKSLYSEILGLIALWDICTLHHQTTKFCN